MTISFTYDEAYIKMCMPSQLKTAVFDLYLGGFGSLKGKPVIILRRKHGRYLRITK